MKIGYLDTNNKNNIPFIDFIGKLSRINICPSILILAGIDIKSAKKVGKLIRIGNYSYEIKIIYTNKSQNEKTLILINEATKNEINIIDNKTNQFIIQNKNKTILVEAIHWPNYNEKDNSNWLNEFSKQDPKKHKIADILIGNFGLDLLTLNKNYPETANLKVLVEYFDKLQRFLITKSDIDYTYKTPQYKKILDYIFSKYNGHIGYSQDIISNHKYMEFLLDSNYNLADTSMSANMNLNPHANIYKALTKNEPNFSQEQINRGCNKCACYNCKMKTKCIVQDETYNLRKGLGNCKLCYGDVDLNCSFKDFLDTVEANKKQGIKSVYNIQQVVDSLKHLGFVGIDTRNDKYGLPHLKAIGKNRIKDIEFGLPRLYKINFIDGSPSNAFYNTMPINKAYEVWSEIVELGCDTIGKGVW